MTDAELQLATGLSSAVFFSQSLWTDTPGAPEGQTYCQYFANDAGMSIAFSVLTGPSFDSVFMSLFSVGGEAVPGIGDEALVAPDGSGAGARVGGVGILVTIVDLSGSGFGTFDVKAATVAILEVVAGRV